MKGREKSLSIGLVVAAALFCLAVTAIALVVNIKASGERQAILEESIKNRLLSACYAVRDDLDVDTLVRYQSWRDVEADPEPFNAIRQRLRKLGDELGVDFIYLLRTMGGKCVIVTDSDDDDTELFAEYPPGDVHLAAFDGEITVGVMNLQDTFGSFNTAAIPFYHNGEVAGVVSVDIRDAYLQRSTASRQYNTALLTIALCTAMAVMLATAGYLAFRMRKAQKALSYLAHHDTVSGLPNRQCFAQQLEKATSGPNTAPFALFFLDLDNFKAVNDGAGHDAGDRVLRQVGQLLSDFAGPQDFAGRYGGDEFVLMAPGIATEEATAQKAKNLLAKAKPLATDGAAEKYGVRFSVGVALFPVQASDGGTLLAYADTAMYHAKTDGKNTFRLYGDAVAPEPGEPSGKSS